MSGKILNFEGFSSEPSYHGYEPPAPSVTPSRSRTPAPPSPTPSRTRTPAPPSPTPSRTRTPPPPSPSRSQGAPAVTPSPSSIAVTPSPSSNVPAVTPSPSSNAPAVTPSPSTASFTSASITSLGTENNPPYYVYGNDGANGLGYYYPVFLSTEGIGLSHAHNINGVVYHMPNSEMNHAATSLPIGYNRAPNTEEAPINTAYFVYGDDGKWGTGYYYPVHLYNHNIGEFHQHTINSIIYYMPNGGVVGHAMPFVPDTLGLFIAPNTLDKTDPESEPQSFEYYNYSGSISGVFTRICETTSLADESNNAFGFSMDFGSNTTIQIPQDFKCTYIEHSKLYAKIEEIK